MSLNPGLQKLNFDYAHNRHHSSNCDYKESYKAAGVLPFAFIRRQLHFLLPVEPRPENGFAIRLNLLGGQRDYGDESSLITAARELSEETGKCIRRKVAEKLLKQPADFVSRHCIEQGKYVLYVCKLKKEYFNLPQQYSSLQYRPSGAEADALVWVSAKALKDALDSSQHSIELDYVELGERFSSSPVPILSIIVFFPLKLALYYCIMKAIKQLSRLLRILDHGLQTPQDVARHPYSGEKRA